MFNLKYLNIVIASLFIILFSMRNGFTEVEIEMETTTIKANTELPKIIYIIPWKQTKQQKHMSQDLIIHSLYETDIFSPVLPDEN